VKCRTAQQMHDGPESVDWPIESGICRRKHPRGRS
jgi:hypothetical protein